jgi:hypothetical protein
MGHRRQWDSHFQARPSRRCRTSNSPGPPHERPGDDDWPARRMARAAFDLWTQTNVRRSGLTPSPLLWSLRRRSSAAAFLRLAGRTPRTWTASIDKRFYGHLLQRRCWSRPVTRTGTAGSMMNRAVRNRAVDSP